MTPNEFHNEESTVGPPLRVQLTFRLSLPMDNRVQLAAMESRCDRAVIIRQALHEYFERRGIDAWLPT